MSATGRTAAEVAFRLEKLGLENVAAMEGELDAGVWSLSRIPLVSPACDGRQMFINHPDASSYLSRRTVQYLVRGQDPLAVAASQEERLQEAIDELSARQLAVTVGYLAKGLPVFDVVFAADGTFEVMEISG